jgi:hypothetical protein
VPEQRPVVAPTAAEDKETNHHPAELEPGLLEKLPRHHRTTELKSSKRSSSRISELQGP